MDSLKDAVLEQAQIEWDPEQIEKAVKLVARLRERIAKHGEDEDQDTKEEAEVC